MKKNNATNTEPIIRPLTKEEIEQSAKERVSFINKEFADGFEFINKYDKSVTFFGSARFTNEDEHYNTAYNVARKLSLLGYTIVTGGGGGIMEASNRGGFDAGGKSVGLNIKLPHEQKANPYLTDKMDFYYFFSRKVALSFAAEAYIFFPGGFGTLNEMFEILTLVQTKKILPIPIILVGKDYWEPLNTFIRENIYERHSAIDEGDMDLYKITDEEDEIIKYVVEEPVVTGIKFNPQ